MSPVRRHEGRAGLFAGGALMALAVWAPAMAQDAATTTVPAATPVEDETVEALAA